MFIIGNFIYAIASIAAIIITMLQWLIIIRALISWVNPDPYNPIVQFLYRVTEPILVPFRRLFPAFNVGLDLSPIFAILTLIFIRLFVIQSLFTVAARFTSAY